MGTALSSRLQLATGSFTPEQTTEVHVSFEPAGDETRVTVEHYGWETIPQQHAARHGFPLNVFLLRHAEWWQALLWALRQHAPRGTGNS